MMIARKILMVVSVVLLGICFCFAEQAFPSLEPIAEWNEDFSEPEDIIKAGLVFSECSIESESGHACLEQYRLLERTVTSKDFMSLPEKERAEKILSQMYSDVLIQYESGQTRIDTMFEQGTYNCVSSSLLYMALCKAAKISVKAQRTPLHLFCTVTVQGSRIDVETTNPLGFEPGVKKNVSKSGNSTRYAVIPKANYSGRHEVSDKMAVSLVARNLTSSYMKANNFERAVPLAVTRLVFLQDEKDTANDSRQDLDTACTNYVVYLQKKNLFFDALSWADALVDRWGSSVSFQKTYDNAIYNCIVGFCNADDYENAEECLEDRKNRVSAKQKEELEEAIFLQKTNYRVKAITNYDQAIAFLNQELGNPVAKRSQNVRKKLTETIEYTWLKKIDSIAASGDYIKAAACADSALAAFGGSAKLRNAKRQNLYNHSVTVHNAFAKLANEKKYDEALEEVDKGLEVNPSSDILKKDKRSVEAIIKKKSR